MSVCTYCAGYEEIEVLDSLGHVYEERCPKCQGRSTSFLLEKKGIVDHKAKADDAMQKAIAVFEKRMMKK